MDIEKLLTTCRKQASKEMVSVFSDDLYKDGEGSLRTREAIQLIRGKTLGLILSLRCFAGEALNVPTVYHDESICCTNTTITVGELAVRWLSNFVDYVRKLDGIFGNEPESGESASLRADYGAAFILASIAHSSFMMASDIGMLQYDDDRCIRIMELAGYLPELMNMTWDVLAMHGLESTLEEKAKEQEIISCAFYVVDVALILSTGLINDFDVGKIRLDEQQPKKHSSKEAEDYLLNVVDPLLAENDGRILYYT